jgi:hypothetical protein
VKSTFIIINKRKFVMKAWKLSPLVAAVVSFNAIAIEATGISLGSGYNFSPSVVLNTENNDNIYGQSSDEESSSINRLAPSFLLSGDFGKTTFNSNYQAELGSYSSSSDEDYLDQQISVDASFELTSRHQIDIEANYFDGHDARGSVIGAETDFAGDPDEYTEVAAGIMYFLGYDTAIANVEFYADTFQKRYNNNELQTSDREYDKNTFGAQLSLSISSATKLLLEARQAKITYENSLIGKDGQEQHLLTGMRWDMTGSTSGEVKIGQVTRTFIDSNRNSGAHINWSANLSWQPRSYSTVLLTTAQNAIESNGTGNYISSSLSRVSWNHQFPNFITAGISANYGEDEYIKNPRSDTNSGFGINATYSPLMWMDIDFSASKSVRNSNIINLDREINLISVGLTLAL